MAVSTLSGTPTARSTTTPQDSNTNTKTPLQFSEGVKGCKTPNCVSASYLLQANGYCTACNTKAKLHTKLVKLGFQGSVEEVPSTPSAIARVHSQLVLGASNGDAASPELNPSSPDFQRHRVSHQRPSIVAAAAPPEVGSAFDGRLTYSFVRRDSEGIPISIGQQQTRRTSSADRHSFSSSEPPAAVVDYQYLRLKFLLNKVRVFFNRVKHLRNQKFQPSNLLLFNFFYLGHWARCGPVGDLRPLRHRHEW
jgi:hypothetical protein